MFEDRIAQLNEGTAPAICADIPNISGLRKRTYTVEEIQNILGIGRSAAYQLVKSGQFHVVKIGQQIRVPVKVFDAWLDGLS